LPSLPPNTSEAPAASSTRLAIASLTRRKVETDPVDIDPVEIDSELDVAADGVRLLGRLGALLG